ncbi:MAG: hypothetical protein IKT40_07485 [Bacilli bacterium]|nr:hypothetical protein [Bacilli bacterium]
MTDDDIIDYFVNKEKGMLISVRINKKNINKVPEMMVYLENRFEDKFISYSETVARIYHKIERRPRCRVCGVELKYNNFKDPYRSGKWCSVQCQLRDKEFIEWRNNKIDWECLVKKSKQTCLEKYGNENYKNHDKGRETMLNKYGCECAFVGSLKQKMQERLLKEIGKKSKTNVEKIKQTKLERYGDPKYTNPEKRKQTMLDKYGCEYTLQSEELRNKVKKTCLDKYGDENYRNFEKINNTLIERYGITTKEMLDEARKKIDVNKILETKAKNGTFNTSKFEEKLYKSLISIFGEDGVKKEYNDERYCNPNTKIPYNCDFYIPSKDLFIELQGHYTHGEHPFDPNNEKDIKKVKFLNENKDKKPSYAKFLEVWCEKDVIKRNVAKDNNLNYIELFNINDIKSFLKDYELS